jgi:subtilisin family serine protease
VRRVLALTFAIVALPIPAARAADPPARIVVSRDPGLTGGQRADILQDAGVTLQQTLPVARAEVVTAVPGDTAGALRDLRADPRVTWAEVDHVRHIASDDEYFADQWALGTAALDASAAWDAGARGAGVTVAVVDTGVDLHHPDLEARLSAPSTWKDYVGGDADPQDEEGHGTLVAGVVGATSDNQAGIAGVAPAVTILPVRVLDATGAGHDSAIASGLKWAAEHGASIVNASFAGPDPSSLVEQVVQSHPGTLFVTAAGNEGTDDDAHPQYPCSLPEANVVCVGASDQHDAPVHAGSWATNYGRHSVDLFAPGAGVLSTWVDTSVSPADHTYASADGTSLAAPQVAGVAALLTGHDPTGWSRLPASYLAAALRASVDPVPALDGLSVTGGRIDARLALDQTAPDPPPAPAPTATPTAPAASTSAPVQATDTDGDGRADAVDACPTLPAATATGCPVPQLRALRVSARHRTVAATVRADRFAQISVRLERRTCRRHRCAYRRVAAKTAVARGTTLSRRVGRGRYRVTVRLSSAAGAAAAVRRAIRVR